MFRHHPISRCLALTLLVVASMACDQHDPEHAHDTHSHDTSGEPEPWAVTAWGERYEIFPEIDPLIAGKPAESHTHVTVLDGFQPLLTGRVEVVLRGADGREQVFYAEAAKRPGIFNITLAPAAEGDYELLFRVNAAAGFEEIPGGRVRVGSLAAPGGLLQDGAEADGDAVGFLKEQQWKTPFATAAATRGELRGVVVGAGEVIPRPGGERVLTAPAAGRLEAATWPHIGLGYRGGQSLFQLVPSLDPDRSLAELEAEAAAFAADLEPLTARAERAARLAAAGIVSIQEAELARGEQRALEARWQGAKKDIESYRRARSGATAGGEPVRIQAPFEGTLAALTVTAGQTVEAGETLGRFVATDRLWLQLFVPASEAASLAAGPVDLALRRAGSADSNPVNEGARLVARSPAVDPVSGRVEVLIELPQGQPGLLIGLAVEAELAVGAPRVGVVLPSSAVVDDAGIAVVYVQLEGESFARREVQLLARQGARVLVAGIDVGERVVTEGGAAIRRATLVGAGVGEAHVH